MRESNERRTSSDLITHIPAVEKFAHFIEEAAAGLRSELAGVALSDFLGSFLNYALLVVVLKRKARGFPYIHSPLNNPRDCAGEVNALLPDLEKAWSNMGGEGKLWMPELPDDVSSVESSPFASIAIEPLHFADETWGLLAVGSRREEDFSNSARSMLKVTAGQLALVLHNDLLYEHVQAMNQEILESQSELQDLSLLTQYSSAAVVVFERVHNGDVYIMRWNEGAKEVFGYSGQEMTTVLNSLDRLVPKEGEHVHDIPPWRWRESRVVGREITLQSKDGRLLDLMATVIVLPGPDDEAKRCLAIFEDITALKYTQRSLESALEIVERKNLELERFSRVVSHDLKSPLALISGYSDLLEDTIGKTIDAHAHEFLIQIKQQAKRMTEFVSSLLEYARTGQTEPVWEQCSMDELVQMAMAELTYQLHTIGATVDITEELPIVYGDSTRIVQVWRNLLGNAFKYRDPNRQLHLCIGCRQLSNGMWAFSLSDTGLGIPDEEKDRIFDLYHRVEKERKIDSTGLGLALVKRIVEQHGGSISLSSIVGEGSTFTFTLGKKKSE